MDINAKMQRAFSDQITAELYSSNLYLQMAWWFRKEGWKGFANWMFKQSDEEKGHAMDMANFVLNRGGEVKLGKIEPVPTDYTDPKQIFEKTMEHEKHVSELIHTLAELAEDEHDRASVNFVDKYIDEQVEEETNCRDILNLFRHRDGHTVATIDDIVGTREN